MPVYRYGVNYRALANYLQPTTQAVSLAGLVARLRAYADADPAVIERMLQSIAVLSPDADWWNGLEVVCGVLRSDNPRFLPALFMEWVLEDL